MLLSLLATIVIEVSLSHHATHSSYNDGYAWGEANTIGVLGKTAPSCSLSEMTSSTEVDDPNFIFNKPEGDSKPSDNFSEWEPGCEAGAQKTVSDSS